VREAVAALPENLRTVVVLFYMRGHSHREISEFLEIPVSTIKKRLFTARQKLKEKMISMIAQNMNDNRPSKNEVFAQQVKNFTTQFSQLIKEGTSIVRSLKTLAEESSDPEFQKIIETINQDIQLGANLSAAMEKHPQAFTTEYISIIRRAEVEGCLNLALQNLSR
jgi:type II secretory pathway component PulF